MKYAKSNKAESLRDVMGMSFKAAFDILFMRYDYFLIIRDEGGKKIQITQAEITDRNGSNPTMETNALKYEIQESVREYKAEKGMK